MDALGSDKAFEFEETRRMMEELDSEFEQLRDQVCRAGRRAEKTQTLVGPPLHPSSTPLTPASLSQLAAAKTQRDELKTMKESLASEVDEAKAAMMAGENVAPGNAWGGAEDGK